tara:strand:- start:1102 stop:1317 length:216 start_codon:yes stop_codon:yes gene_type:complete
VKVGELVKVVYPLPDLTAGVLFSSWVKELSLTGKPVPLIAYAGPGGHSKVFHDGLIKYIATDILSKLGGDK